MANWLRTLFALALLAGTYLAVAVVAAIDLSFMAWPWLVYLEHPGFSLATMSAMFAGVTASGLLAIVSGLGVIRQVGEPWRSIQLPVGGTEPLREMIGALAARARTAAPPDLRLTAIANAGVTERPRLLGLRGGGRTLYLGLPLLVGMTETQLRAVLSHEMGHYAGGHALPGRLVHRGLVSLAGLRAAMRMILSSQPQRVPRLVRPFAVLAWAVLVGYGTVGYWIFTGYETVYRRLSFAMRRGQEYDADRIAERIVGGAELAGALRRIQVLAAAWRDFETRFLVPMRRAGCLPDDPFEAFGRMLADTSYQEVLRQFEADGGERPTGQADTHPALADRLARLTAGATAPAAPPPAAPPAPPPPAIALIPALPDRPWAAELAKTMRPRGNGRLQPLPWDECLNRTGQARAATAAGGLLRAISGAEAAHPTFTDVLWNIEHRRDELATVLAHQSGNPGAHPVGQLTARLFALIGFTLVARGQARWQVSWRAGIESGSFLLVPWDPADTATEQVAARVNSFVAEPSSGGNESWLLGHLRSLGVDPGKPVDIATAHGRPPGNGPAAPGRTLVIAPAAELVEVRQSQTTGRIMAGVMSAIAIGVGLAASHARSAPQLPLTPHFTLPAPLAQPYVAPVPSPVAVPTSLFRSSLDLPRLPLLATVPGSIGGCPPPLGAGRLCTVITVRPGDTLSLLACRYQTSVSVLRRLNQLGSAAIDAGQPLTVPFSPVTVARCG